MNDIQGEAGAYDPSLDDVDSQDDTSLENETLLNEEVAEEPKTSETEKSQKSTEASKEFKTVLAQKEHFKRKYEALKNTLSEQLDETPKPTKRNDSGDEWKERVEFLLTNRDVNEKEFNHIAAVSKRDNVSLQEAAKREMDYISFRRAELQKQNKIPSSSQSKSSSFKKSPEEIASMSSAEFRAYEAQINASEEGGQI
jgi:hypothetical protein